MDKKLEIAKIIIGLMIGRDPAKIQWPEKLEDYAELLTSIWLNDSIHCGYTDSSGLAITKAFLGSSITAVFAGPTIHERDWPNKSDFMLMVTCPNKPEYASQEATSLRMYWDSQYVGEKSGRQMYFCGLKGDGGFPDIQYLKAPFMRLILILRMVPEMKEAVENCIFDSSESFIHFLQWNAKQLSIPFEITKK